MPPFGAAFSFFETFWPAQTFFRQHKGPNAARLPRIFLYGPKRSCYTENVAFCHYRRRTMSSKVEEQILSREFDYLQPYFYQNPYALRCELGIGNTTTSSAVPWTIRILSANPCRSRSASPTSCRESIKVRVR